MKPSLMLIARSKPVLFVRIRPIWSKTSTFCPDPVLLVRIRSFLSETGPFGPDTAHFVRNRSFLSGSSPFCPDPVLFVRILHILSETSPFCPKPVLFVQSGPFGPDRIRSILFTLGPFVLHSFCIRSYVRIKPCSPESGSFGPDPVLLSGFCPY